MCSSDLRLLTRSLQNIENANAGVVIAALGVLVAATAIAVAVPVRRALHVDPAVALRHE